MRMIDIIEKKRDGHANTESEIKFAIDGYVKHVIPDYQISSWLMAIYFQGMTDEESALLTKAMLYSGDVIDLSGIAGVKVDKHSTGGVGDKTTLILAPLVASAGAKVAKLSGRGLGHTGGTLDKLESIDGVSISLSEEQFIRQVNEINIAVAGQTQDLVPADKLMYALRDVTGSVPSIPLIASSIMSKKLASGADVICLDVKIGDGAFMKTIEDARILSRLMVSIGASFGKKVVAFISDMDQPLGKAIGNRLEVKEAIETLAGNGPADLTELCVTIGGRMLYLAGKAKTPELGVKLAKSMIKSGQATAKFNEFIKTQGGKPIDLDHFVTVKEVVPFFATQSGYVKTIKAMNIGLISMMLGGGRATKEDTIDPMVGVVLAKKIGDKVKKGEPLLTLYRNKPITPEITALLNDTFEFSNEPMEAKPIIREIIG